MRGIKIPKERQKVIECYNCHCMTLTLFKRAWVEKPVRELYGYYTCTNCGITCTEFFATEMREIKIPKGRPRVIKCRKCYRTTLTLVKKEWKRNCLLRSRTELRGHYECEYCGFPCTKVFAIETISWF